MEGRERGVLLLLLLQKLEAVRTRGEVKEIHGQMVRGGWRVGWKTVIRWYACEGMTNKWIECVRQMMSLSGKLPNHNLFPSLFKSSSSSSHLLLLGLSLHSLALRLGFLSDLFTSNSLLFFYSRLPSSERQKGSYGAGGSDNGSVMKVFERMVVKDVVSWNTVIAGKAEDGKNEEALAMVREMCGVGLKPDSFTLSTILPIFAENVDLSKGKEVHGYSIRHGFHTEVFTGSGLIDMYSNCTSSPTHSLRVFLSLPHPDSISWNSIIAGCVQTGVFDTGLQFFRTMLMTGIKPGPVSFSTIIPACSHLTALRLGTQLHALSVRLLFDHNKFVSTSLIDMYAKCGNVATARLIFDLTGGPGGAPDMIAWTAMTMGYAWHGHGGAAVSLFQEMVMRGRRPGYVLFVALLTACSHGGMVSEGKAYFESMRRCYGITPGLEHHAAMADLLCRVGVLEEAYAFISNMPPFVGTGGVWSALLSACRYHRKVGLAEKVLRKVVEVEPGNTGAHIMLSSMYADTGRWWDSHKVRAEVKKKDMERTPGCSWIQVGNKAHVFVAGDDNSSSHLDYERIRDMLLLLYQIVGTP